MTKMRINLMPRPPREETIKQLRNAQTGAYKLLVHSLRRANEAQGRLIEAYKRYFDFMERRYPVEKWPVSERGSAQPTTEEKKAFAKSLLDRWKE